jgi:predicted ATPase
MLRSLHFKGYRSLRDFRMKLGKVTVVTGENGVGKSNVYRALEMVQRMAQGRFAAAVAGEGGLPSMLWAGELKKSEKRRVSWIVDHEDFHLEMECGMISATPNDPSLFKTDPDIKSEELRHGGAKGRAMASRKGSAIELRNVDGRMSALPLPVHATESLLSEVRDSAAYPAVSAARETILAWRFFDHFPTHNGAPIRQPAVGFWSPELDSDGGNLAANLQTLVESRKSEPLDEIFQKAFPDCSWSAADEMGVFQLKLLRPGLKRWLDASELSEGTLRFFCLCAALLSLKPAPLMVLNEPESSLHRDLLEPLAELIARASEDSQILIVTHSTELADLISEKCEVKRIDLINHEGKTMDRNALSESGGKVWNFGD